MMRKLLFVGVALSVFFIGYSFAGSFAQTYISALDRATSSLSVEAKQSYYIKTSSLLASYAYSFAGNATLFDDISLLKNYVDAKIKSLDTVQERSQECSQEPSSGHFVSSIQLPHVDLQKVRQVRLDLHNTERANQGLPTLIYSEDLERTATTWATYLANMQRTTHKRKSTDGYYSYFSIKNWFLDQGIQFVGKEVGGVTLCTENIGRGYYNCTSSDCTDTLIKAITTSRDFFMREKYRTYKPHYNAIVGKQFTTLGLGVALVDKKYYLVSHYTQDLK